MRAQISAHLGLGDGSQAGAGRRVGTRPWRMCQGTQLLFFLISKFTCQPPHPLPPLLCVPLQSRRLGTSAPRPVGEGPGWGRKSVQVAPPPERSRKAPTATSARQGKGRCPCALCAVTSHMGRPWLWGRGSGGSQPCSQVVLGGGLQALTREEGFLVEEGSPLAQPTSLDSTSQSGPVQEARSPEKGVFSVE